MSRVLVDTSALIAHLDADDPRRTIVGDALRAHADDELVIHGYIVAETLAVARRRLGPGAVASLLDDVLPSLTVCPVDEPTFRAALADLRASLPSSTSFVDQVTLALARAESIGTIVALDPDLASTGLEVIPA